MSNETKREVFDEVLDEWQVDETMPDANWKYPDFKLVRIKEERFKDRYDAALPDDLPVIPEAVGEYIQERKAARDSLALALTARLTPDDVYEWIHTVAGDPDTELSQIEYVKQQDTFATAWVLGVWKVKETGEVVKL